MTLDQQHNKDPWLTVLIMQKIKRFTPKSEYFYKESELNVKQHKKIQNGTDLWRQGYPVHVCKHSSHSIAPKRNISPFASNHIDMLLVCSALRLPSLGKSVTHHTLYLLLVNKLLEWLLRKFCKHVLFLLIISSIIIRQT